MVNAPRTTDFPSRAEGDQAKPTRGWKAGRPYCPSYNARLLFAHENGIVPRSEQLGAITCPPNRVMLSWRSFLSTHGVKAWYRRPRLSVKVSVTRQSSWT